MDIFGSIGNALSGVWNATGGKVVQAVSDLITPGDPSQGASGMAQDAYAAAGRGASSEIDLAGILSNNGGNVVSNNGANILSNNGGNVVSNNGGNILSNNGANILTNNGGNILSDYGGN